MRATDVAADRYRDIIPLACGNTRFPLAVADESGSATGPLRPRLADSRLGIHSQSGC